MPAGPHRVAPGDHLTRIAHVHGLRGPQPLWEDPANAALRTARTTPHILATDDTITVPPLTWRVVERPTTQRHRFVARLPQLLVRVELAHWNGHTRDLGTAEVYLDGVRTTAATIDQTVLEIPITATTDRITIVCDTERLEADVGRLQPIDTVPGYRQRLENLGYRPGSVDDAAAPALRSAIEEFQCDEQITVDGIMGPVTRDRLRRAHGC